MFMPKLTSIVEFLALYSTIEYYCINMVLYKSIKIKYNRREDKWSVLFT